jgi:Pretoxin HINT domain
MKRTCLIATALAATWGMCGLSVAGSRPAGSRNNADAAAKETVQGVLSAERDGAVTNRARRLRVALRTSPQFAPAQWQSGRVNIDGEWVPVHTSIARLANDTTLKEYRALRDKTPKTLAGQMELAAWCLKHKLYPQQRAHLTAALEINPNYAAARKALGHVRMGPFWISRRELEQRRKDAEQAAKDLKRWAPTVKSIRDALTSGSRVRFQRGLKRLKAINDPAAIPAIELALAYDKPRLAMETIDYLGQKSSKESTLALARQGMLSPWKSLRKRVGEKLKGRRLEDFVPQVLSMTSTPLQSKQLLYVDRRGTLYYRHLFGRETPGYKSLGVVGVDVRFLRFRAGTVYDGQVAGLPAQLGAQVRNGNQRDETLGRLRFPEFVLHQQFDANDRTRLITEWNGRSCDLLAIATGRSLGDSAQRWWQWWDTYTDSTRYSRPDTKPEIRIEGYETRYETVPFYLYCSCLVAGTPIWTDHGPVAIETIRIGDRVLAQDVETGELAYKPVLRTTIRPKRPLLALEIGPRTVRMTSGHTFWISGKGWVKARDIKAGMRMHDVSGTTAVRPAGTAKAEPTYNLVVADFHTYFVGESKVLSHDITPAEPTDALVPGLRRGR